MVTYFAQFRGVKTGEPEIVKGLMMIIQNFSKLYLLLMFKNITIFHNVKERIDCNASQVAKALMLLFLLNSNYF